MNNPYSSLPQDAFWKTAVAQRHFSEINNLWKPRFNLEKHSKVSTYGSCFAQHIGKSLRKNGYSWFITEPRPKGISPEEVHDFNYDVFSSRTGNIYTSSLLLQWVDWALGFRDLSECDEIFWTTEDGRYIDPFRPKIEPNGFQTIEELLSSRKQSVSSFGQSLKESDFFIFTMGLIEGWQDINGFEYPMCPGTAGGVFDEDSHIFFKHDFDAVIANMQEVLGKIKNVNESLKCIVTVSPVPLTATKSGDHVVVATMESKSILRAAAAKLYDEYSSFLDYFPSYEIINSPAFKGVWFEPNMRSVSPLGVDFVMKNFIGALKSDKNFVIPDLNYESVCEEQILSDFISK